MPKIRAYNNRAKLGEHMQVTMEADPGEDISQYAMYRYYWRRRVSETTPWTWVINVDPLNPLFNLPVTVEMFDDSGPWAVQWKVEVMDSGLNVVDTQYSGQHQYFARELKLSGVPDLYTDTGLPMNGKTVSAVYGSKINTNIVVVPKLTNGNDGYPPPTDFLVRNVRWLCSGKEFYNGPSLNLGKVDYMGSNTIRALIDIKAQGYTELNNVNTRLMGLSLSEIQNLVQTVFTKEPPDVTEWTSPRETYEFEWAHSMAGLKPDWYIKQEHAEARVSLGSETVQFGTWYDGRTQINVFDEYPANRLPMIGEDQKFYITLSTAVYNRHNERISRIKFDTRNTLVGTTKSTENLIDRANLQLNPLTINMAKDDIATVQSDFIGTSRYKYFPADMFTAGTYEWFWDGKPIPNESKDSITGSVPWEEGATKKLTARYTYKNPDYFVNDQVIEVDFPTVINMVTTPMTNVVPDFRRQYVELRWNDPNDVVTPAIEGLPEGATITKYEWFTTPDDIIATTPTYTIKTDKIQAYTITLKITVEAEGYDQGVFYSRPLGITIAKKGPPEPNEIGLEWSTDKAEYQLGETAIVTFKAIHPDPDVKIENRMSSPSMTPGIVSSPVSIRSPTEAGDMIVTSSVKFISELYDSPPSMTYENIIKYVKDIFDVTAYIQCESEIRVDDIINPFVVTEGYITPAATTKYEWFLDDEAGHGSTPIMNAQKFNTPGDYVVKCVITLEADNYETLVLTSTKTVKVSERDEVPIPVDETEYYTHPLPWRESCFTWMGYWVIDEIMEAKAAGIDWLMSDSGLTYLHEINALRFMIKTYKRVEVQESRNGYILTKDDLV